MSCIIESSMLLTDLKVPRKVSCIDSVELQDNSALSTAWVTITFENANYILNALHLNANF